MSNETISNHTARGRRYLVNPERRAKHGWLRMLQYEPTGVIRSTPLWASFAVKDRYPMRAFISASLYCALGFVDDEQAVRGARRKSAGGKRRRRSAMESINRWFTPLPSGRRCRQCKKAHYRFISDALDGRIRSTIGFHRRDIERSIRAASANGLQCNDVCRHIWLDVGNRRHLRGRWRWRGYDNWGRPRRRASSTVTSCAMPHTHHKPPSAWYMQKGDRPCSPSYPRLSQRLFLGAASWQVPSWLVQVRCHLRLRSF